MKTTVYLPEDLKHRLASLARERETSEAALIREAVEQLVATRGRRPRLGLYRSTDGGVADRVDEALARGFGIR